VFLSFRPWPGWSLVASAESRRTEMRHILGARRVQTGELLGIEASAKEWASGLREDKADAMVSHPGRA